MGIDNRMKNLILRYIAATLCVVATMQICWAKSVESDSIESILRHLDHVLHVQNHVSVSPQIELNKSLSEYKSARTPDEEYNSLRNLFNLYRTYKLDSALIVADKRLIIARNLADNNKIISASLNMADIYSKVGHSDLATLILDTLDKKDVSAGQMKYINNIYKTVYKNKLRQSLLPRERIEALERLKQIRKSEMNEADKNSRTFYMLQIEELREAGMYKEALAHIDEMSKKFEVDSNAQILFEMGLTYLEAGCADKGIELLAKSAAIDIENGTKEYKSLILLASVLFERGDLNRAFEYINYALDDSIESNAQIRTEEIIKIIPNIYQAFSKKERELKRRTAWFLGAIGVLNLLLLILIVALVREHKIKRGMIQEINSINSGLTLRNKSLVESDKKKMEHLKQFMMAYANHIAKQKDFRKNLRRLLTTSQYSQAIERLKKEKEETSETTAFQEMFDAAFISMFPDFIYNISTLLKDVPENVYDDKLTPELRIAALMKLGITSTSEISEMFQYSSQSVYNLRSSLRNRLKISWEEFEERVHTI